MTIHYIFYIPGNQVGPGRTQNEPEGSKTRTLVRILNQILSTSIGPTFYNRVLIFSIIMEVGSLFTINDHLNPFQDISVEMSSKSQIFFKHHQNTMKDMALLPKSKLIVKISWLQNIF